MERPVLPKDIRIVDTVLEKVTAQCPEYLSPTAFINQLVDNALDNMLTLGLPSAAKEVPLTSTTTKELIHKKKNKTKTREAFSSKQLPDDCMPNELLDCDQLLREFWSVKKGTRSESVFNRVCRKLEAWTPDDRRRALEAAISGGWGDVFEPRATPAQRSTFAKPVGVIGEDTPEFQTWLHS